MGTNDIELVARARVGDRAALRRVVRAMNDLVYPLSAWMLGGPPDAEHATREILIRLVTGLGSFRCDRSLRIWVYRIAIEHLRTTRFDARLDAPICSAMLRCLDREDRLAFVLGEILQLSNDDAAAVLAVTPEAFGERRARARTLVEAFVRDAVALLRSLPALEAPDALADDLHALITGARSM